MADITISYKGNTIAEVSASGTTTLGTANKYCEDNIAITYVQPNPSSATDITITYGESTIAEVSTSGTTTLGTKGKYCTSNILLEYVRPSIQIITDDSIYLLRQLPYNSNAKTMQKIVGCSFAWNQIAALGNGIANNASLSYNATTKETTVTPTRYNTDAVGAYGLISTNAVVGHKYLLSISVNLDHSGSIRFGFGVGLKTFANINSGHYVNLSNIQNHKSASSLSVYLNANSSGWTDGIYKFKDVQCIDLTVMFGSTIADYIYALEQGTAGAGVAFFKNLFPKDYYPYSAGTLVSVKPTASKMKNADESSVSSYPLSGIELRGLPKLDANNKLYYDGDEYAPSGTVTRKYGIVDMGTIGWSLNSSFNGSPAFVYTFNQAKIPSGNGVIANILTPIYETKTANALYVASSTSGIICLNTSKALQVRDFNYSTVADFKAAMSGVYLIYELATPTTESATDYTARQTCYPNGTEEFVDGRTVEIPVNAVADYEVTS